MHIRRIELSGFMGISNEHPLVLENLGKFNVIIGPNNSGKSIVPRFLRWFSIWMKQFLTLQVDTRLECATWTDLFWQFSARHPIEAEIRFDDGSGDSQELFSNVSMIVGGEFRIHVTVNPPSESDSQYCEFFLEPRVFVRRNGLEPKWQSMVDRDPQRQRYMDGTGNYSETNTRDVLQAAYRSNSKKIHWCHFDHVRALDRGNPKGLDGVTDGSKLMWLFFEMSKKIESRREWTRIQNEMRDFVNSILKPLGISGIARIEPKEEDRDKAALYISFEADPSNSVNIAQIGSGLHQLVIVAAELALAGKKSTIMLLEEPETNCHPGLLLGFIRQIRKHENVQLFLTTHSNVLLEELGDGDTLFVCRQVPDDGHIECESCCDVVAKHNLLDALGVTAAALLQANCLLWVEGPSDRLYLRTWIEKADSSLIEGRDFAFAFYGGWVRKHHAVDPERAIADDVLDVLKVCRYAGFYMDRDGPPSTTPNSALDESKRKILDDCEGDPKHRRAVVSTGREIENDLSPDVIQAVVAELLGVEPSRCSKLHLTSERDYHVEILDWVKSQSDLPQNGIASILTKKMKLAMRAIPHLKASTSPPPEYIGQFIELIRGARGREP